MTVAVVSIIIFSINFLIVILVSTMPHYLELPIPRIASNQGSKNERGELMGVEGLTLCRQGQRAKKT